MNAEATSSPNWAKTSDGFFSMEPIKLNWRRRFWRWLLGYEGQLYTREQVRDMQDVAVKSSHLASTEKDRVDSIVGSRRIQIIDAVNGKIIRFSSGDNDPRAISRTPVVALVDQYYVVKEGEALLDGIARLIATDRIAEK